MAESSLGHRKALRRPRVLSDAPRRPRVLSEARQRGGADSKGRPLSMLSESVAGAEAREVAEEAAAGELRPSPPKGFNDLLQDIKSMITESQEEASNTNPRVAHFKACNNRLTSMRPPHHIMAELERVARAMGLHFVRDGPCALEMLDACKDVRFTAEVCSLPNLSQTYFVRVRRISGEWSAFQALLNQMSESLSL
eukprot:TRINITY_DN6257_c0_g1_i2.p1 TRINITY_DN6257_c0_g1~~TRINITY_DN6257_c0_g1_i2.p1  ORF type:complete len:210 (+),score=74.53 TRINITY_DN6257_c0_g1_i2:45-632(+)